MNFYLITMHTFSELVYKEKNLKKKKITNFNTPILVGENAKKESALSLS